MLTEQASMPLRRRAGVAHAGRSPSEVRDPRVPYYDLIVSAHPDIDARAVESETGLRCTPAERGWRLDGELVDRAALHGAIARIFRLGLELLSLERRSSRHAT
jgi:hypothetical protein